MKVFISLESQTLCSVFPSHSWGFVGPSLFSWKQQLLSDALSFPHRSIMYPTVRTNMVFCLLCIHPSLHGPGYMALSCLMGGGETGLWGNVGYKTEGYLQTGGFHLYLLKSVCNESVKLLCPVLHSSSAVESQSFFFGLYLKHHCYVCLLRNNNATLAVA